MYIHEELNRTQVNVVNPDKANYKPPSTIDEILLELDISKEDCYHALSISVDENYELHLIQPPNSYFMNTYFDKGLRAWQDKYRYSTSLQ